MSTGFASRIEADLKRRLGDRLWGTLKPGMRKAVKERCAAIAAHTLSILAGDESVLEAKDLEPRLARHLRDAFTSVSQDSLRSVLQELRRAG